MSIVQLERRPTVFYYDAVKIIKKVIEQYYLHCFFLNLFLVFSVHVCIYIKV